MTKEHIERNRPVHLARRDVFYERAVELLHVPMSGENTDRRIRHLENILKILHSASEHGTFALRSSQVLHAEKDFLHFMQLLSESVAAILSMMKHLLHLESEEGFLKRFLQADSPGALQPSTQYKRRAEDILQGLWHLLRLSHGPYQALHKQQVQNFNEVERDRYERAVKSFRLEVTNLYRPPANVAVQDLNAPGEPTVHPS